VPVRSRWEIYSSGEFFFSGSAPGLPGFPGRAAAAPYRP
jgi:hypothetical protein